jgi:hypothetical protein
MRLAVMNPPAKFLHNANLPVTIAPNGRIVNGFPNNLSDDVSYDEMIIEDAVDQLPELDSDIVLDTELNTEEKQAEILFVKIANNIYQYNLKPKIIELYMVLALIIKQQPKFRFCYRVISKEYKSVTGRGIDKDTVNAYVLELIKVGLLQKGKNKNYHLGVGIDIGDSECNYYKEPKSCYTRYYRKINQTKLTKNEVVLEHYIASLPYRRLRRTKVTRELNISLISYNLLLKSLRAKNIIYRNVLINKNIRFQKMFYYYPVLRNQLKRDYEDDKVIRYVIKREAIYEAKQRNLTKPVHPSKYWYTGKMGEYMAKYGINYHPKFKNYNIQDAYDIIQELESQNRNQKLSAQLVVKAILDGYNWDKIVARRHDELKKKDKKLPCNTY